MTQRLKAVTGFLAAATLLSGSAFAFAPEFDQDLPTVVITDSIPGYVSPAFDVNGIPSAATEYVFRYTHAFALQDYVIDLQGNSFDQTKFVFNEFDSFSDDQPNPQHTLLINGDQGFADGGSNTFPLAADVDSAGQLLNERYADGGLDFRNRDFSGDDEGVNTGFGPIGAITGDDIRVSNQQRVVQLYIKGDTSDELVIRDFLAITTIDGNDRLESPVFTAQFEEIFNQDDLVGWVGGALGSLAFIPINGNTFSPIIGSAAAISGYTFNPAAGAATTAGTDTVSLTATSTQIGFARWDYAPGLALAENELYRLRANIYSANAASRDTIRLEMGNGILAGQSTVNFDEPPASHSSPDVMSTATDSVLVSYLQPETAAASGEWSVTTTIINIGNGTGQDFVIGEISVDRAINGLASLGSSAVILNQGGAISTDGDPVVDPVASPTPFNTSSTPVAGETWEFGALNTAANVTSNLTSSQLSVTFPTSSGVAPPAFGALALATSDTVEPWNGGAFQVAAGKLYQLDIWASTSSGQTAVNSVADLRVDVGMNGSFSAHLLKDLSPVGDLGSGPVSINGISSTPRAYSLFFEYQGALATAEAGLTLQLQSFNKTYPSASTVTINRVTLREYDAPSIP